MTETNTTDNTVFPPTMEVAGAIVAEHCYKDKELHQELLKDPMEGISNIIGKFSGKNVDWEKSLPNCKVHSLQNTSNRWHIVLPFEYHGEEPSKENGIILEDDLESVVGGFLVAATTIASVAGLVTTGLTIVTSGSAAFAFTASAAAASGLTVLGVGTLIQTGVVAGIVAGIVAGGAALTAGVTIGGIAALNADGIIDVW